MHICPNCQHTSETPAAFCARCGTAMVEQAVEQPVVAPVEMPVSAQPVYQPPVQPTQPVYQQPAQPTVTYQQPTYQQPAYQQPTYPYAAEPVTTEPSKGKTITGMILSIAGTVMSAIGFLYSFLFSMVGALEEPELAAVGLVFSIIFCIFSFPLSLIGLLLSKNGTHTMNKVGKVLGIIGLVVSGAMVILPMLAMSSNPYYYY